MKSKMMMHLPLFSASNAHPCRPRAWFNVGIAGILVDGVSRMIKMLSTLAVFAHANQRILSIRRP